MRKFIGRNTKRCIIFIALFFAINSISAQSQKRILFGHISNENGDPIQSATVINLISKNKTVADVEGNFQIEYNAKDSFEISAVSYSTLILNASSFKGQTIHTIILKHQPNYLEEVVVSTGYQQFPKERSTGSFSLINKDLFNEQVGPGILERLEGIANGLTVDKKTNSQGISIRGLSTLRGPRGPLVILDNFPYEGDINNLNPNEVESITLLKDAAAASVWGARAGNGVIVITTKKGRYNKPMSLELSSNYSMFEKTDLHRLEGISASSLVDVHEFLFDNKFKLSDTASNSHPNIFPVYELLLANKKGLLSNEMLESKLNELRNNDIRADFEKYMYRRAINRQFSINLSGGKPKIAWYLGAGYDKNTSTLNENYERISLNQKTTITPFKGISLFANISYTGSRNVSGRYPFKSNEFFSYDRLADEDGNPISYPGNYRQIYTDTAGAGKLLDWHYYPLFDYQFNRSNSSITDLLANIGANISIFSGFKLSLYYQYERQQKLIRTEQDENSHFTRILINNFSQIDWNTGNVDYIIPKGAILNLESNSLKSSQARTQISYSKSWRNVEYNGIAGFEIRNAKTDYFTAKYYGYNSENGLSINVDYAHSYPNYVTGYNSNIPANNAVGYSVNRFVSGFTNSSLTLYNKYTGSVSARRDASNFFGINANQRWNPLWSIGAAWKISNESFFKSKKINNLNLRTTYGISGNINPKMSAVTTIQYLGSSSFLQSPWAVINNYANPELRWEKVKMINFGIDLTAFNNRLLLNLDIYQKRATDLYDNSPIDYTAGAGNNIIKNAASMKGTGMDLGLNVLLIDNKFQWRLSAFENYYKDEVTDVQLTNSSVRSLLNTGTVMTAQIGKPVYGVYSFYWAGLDPQNGDPLGFVNGNPSHDYSTLSSSKMTVDSLKYNGPLFPVHSGAIANTFSYHRISLTFRLLYKLGYFYRKSSISYSNLFYSNDGNSDFEKRWQKPGDEKYTYVPSMTYPSISNRDFFYNNAEILVKKADNIRIQYINISCELNQRFVHNLHMKMINIFLNCSNLGIIWRASKDVRYPDYQDNIIPPSRIYSIGINCKL
jgi:TonB-linked SusC/RagA family outer membrane protein